MNKLLLDKAKADYMKADNEAVYYQVFAEYTLTVSASVAKNNAARSKAKSADAKVKTAKAVYDKAKAEYHESKEAG